jgi:hypothetical protein
VSGLRVQVRTRSKVLDYRFIGDNMPQDRWWEKNYGRWTDFARPTILVEPGRFFVSGIVSTRTDSRGAGIHVALLAEVDPEGTALAAQVLAHLCDVLRRTGSLKDAGTRLDALGEDDWNAALQDDPAAVVRISSDLMCALEEWAGQAEFGPAPGPFWLSKADPQAFAVLADTAAAVIQLDRRRPERALYLNLASSSELAQLVRDGSGIVCREVDRLPKPRRPLLTGAALLAGGLMILALLALLGTD